MDEPSSPAGPYVVDREKTAPFLIRAFVKVNGFHRPQQFEDGPLPVADEQQLFTWKDATLTEVLTTLRNIAPLTPEYRHPLARYSFRAIFADPTARGRFSFKDLGTVYSRDILGEPGTLDSTAPRLLKDSDGERTTDGVEPQPQVESGAGGGGSAERERERRAEVRTLDELRFVPGDYMSVSVILPKNATVVPGELSIKGSAGSGAPPPSNGWKGANAVGLGSGTGSGGGGGFGGGVAPGRGGGHWRGGSDAPVGGGGGGGGFGSGRGRGRGAGMGLDDRDRRGPPPLGRRRESPPPRGGGGWGDRGRDRGDRDRLGRERRSRSRSPRRSRR
ncbi:uncharacterized protein STEHIDRAFT_145790 [Stereum hirsutum FP-91666 SS1]|uniref:uncharacterized protein n=1 Tax=Stereum hirsutum (strain FP-91666) TaxID=721885 RepID=UPI000440BD31|nr:uncharacterized protein STEHIDRAFT_145790 [Stereum hirsutum FP-91666 SS1]EIM89012.1 hypothetical protein STEHIDRAFT_145790 [Stereum hirsutum FP-91666 SS1]